MPHYGKPEKPDALLITAAQSVLLYHGYKWACAVNYSTWHIMRMCSEAVGTV